MVLQYLRGNLTLAPQDFEGIFEGTHDLKGRDRRRIERAPIQEALLLMLDEVNYSSALVL